MRAPSWRVAYARALIGLLTAIALGCAKHTPPPASPLHATPVSVLALPGDANARLAQSITMSKPLRGVIRNGTAWSVFWARVENDTAAVPTVRPPAVDFSREMLLVATDGRRPAGHRIEIVGAAQRNHTLFVLVRSWDDRTGPASAPLAPVAVVRVPRTDGPVVFRAEQSPSAALARP
jgi:hypothetical protein